MDDSWLEEECLTVLQQSSVLEFTLPPANHLNLKCLNSPIALHRESTKSRGDSASSAISDNLDEAPASPSIQSIELQKEKTKEHVDAARDVCDEVLEKDIKKSERVRSWSGSPDWDFKEGCSYSVQSDGLSDDLGFLTSQLGLDFQEERVLFPRMKSSEPTGSQIRTGKMLNQTSKIRCDNNLRVDEDLAVMDSARDVSDKNLFRDDFRDVAFPFTTSSFGYPTDLCKSESMSSSFMASDIMKNDITHISLGRPCASKFGQGSLLRRVKNEVDIELLEEIHEGEGEMESLDDTLSSYSDGSDGDGDHRPKSTTTTFGHILNLVVGIGACAVFQIMK